MGHWAKNRRRGGGGAPPPAAVSILSVIDIGDNSVAVTFSGAVTIVPSFLADGAFTCGSDEAINGAQASPTVINLDMGAAESGQDWLIVSQPTWLLEPVNFPAGGSVG